MSGIQRSMLLIAHAAATFAMVGLIWFVQIIHYPLFALVPPEAFPAYESEHVARTGIIIAPIMLAEMATGVLLAERYKLAFALLVLIWIATFFVSVPLHNKLAAGFDAAAHSQLVATNWIRTILWTARGTLLAWALHERISSAA